MCEINLINEQIAAKNALYAMLSCNAYHQDRKIYFPVKNIGWILVDRDGDITDEPTKESKITGFAYDIYEDRNSNKSVIAFRGTDSKKDWLLSNLAIPFSIPYKQANEVVERYLKNNPNKNLVLVGHSLGGGLALGASVRYGVPAITFNSSPRIFDGLGDKHEAAMRIVIYQDGEPLEKARNHLKKYMRLSKKKIFMSADMILKIEIYIGLIYLHYIWQSMVHR